MIEQLERAIVLHRDEAHHQKMKVEIEKQQIEWQHFADAFKELDLGTLEGERLNELYCNTEGVSFQKWRDKQTIPPGFITEQYLNLLVKPDFSKLFEVRTKLNQLHPDLFFVEDWKVLVNHKVAERLAAGNDISILEGSRNEELYNAVKKLSDLLTEIDEMDSHHRILQYDPIHSKLLPIDLSAYGLHRPRYSEKLEVNLPILCKLFR